MSDPSKTGQNEPQAEPLSPEALAVLKRARRSFGLSMGILLIGFMAIAFALVYRAMREAPPEALAGAVSVPAGAEIVSAVAADGTLSVTYRLDGAVILRLLDAGSGELRREIGIIAE